MTEETVVGQPEAPAEGDQVLDDATALAAALRLSERRVDALREARTEMMRDMHDTHHRSWAEIARVFGVTPQAAMYATGHATRTARRK